MLNELAARISEIKRCALTNSLSSQKNAEDVVWVGFIFLKPQTPLLT